MERTKISKPDVVIHNLTERKIGLGPWDLSYFLAIGYPKENRSLFQIDPKAASTFWYQVSFQFSLVSGFQKNQKPGDPETNETAIVSILLFYIEVIYTLTLTETSRQVLPFFSSTWQ